MALSHGESSRIEDVTSTLSPGIFPFVTLPAEIRLMIYDAAMPDEAYLTGSVSSLGLPSAIKALMRIKVIRNEVLHHLFSKYRFNWVDVTLPFESRFARHGFKKDALPYITSLSISLREGFQQYPWGYASHKPGHFRALLRWMRWRSRRSHLYPWHLKKLELVETRAVPDHGFHRRFGIPHDCHLSFQRSEVLNFLKVAAMVPGLESLTIILYCKPSDQAVKTFLERCARNGTEGRVGNWQCGHGKVIEWLHLRDGQVSRMAG